MIQRYQQDQIVYRFSASMYPKIEQWKVTSITPEIVSFELGHNKINRSTESFEAYIDNEAYHYNAVYTTKENCIKGIEAYTNVMKKNYTKKQQQMQDKIDRIDKYLTNLKLKNK